MITAGRVDMHGPTNSRVQVWRGKDSSSLGQALVAHLLTRSATQVTLAQHPLGPVTHPIWVACTACSS
jgi:hypothetical protein